MDLTTEHLSDYACRLVYEDLSPEVVHQVKRTLVDTGVPVGNPYPGADRPRARAQSAGRRDRDRVGTRDDLRRGGKADGGGGGEVGSRDAGDSGPQHPVPGSRRVSRRRRDAGDLRAASDPGPGAATADQEAEGPATEGCAKSENQISCGSAQEANAMGKTTSATAAARLFSDLLNRVGFRSERPGHARG
jgi:hypothetical protein